MKIILEIFERIIGKILHIIYVGTGLAQAG